MIVVLALMPNCENRHGLVVIDFEKRDVPRSTKRDHQLPQERIVGGCFAAAEGGEFQATNGVLNRLNRSLGNCPVGLIPLEDERIQSDEVCFGVFREADLEFHCRAFVPALALTSIFSSLSITALDETYLPVLCAFSRAARPRAMNSRCATRRPMLSRIDRSTKLERLSPSSKTASAASRSSGSTRKDGIVADFTRSQMRCICNALCRIAALTASEFSRLLLGIHRCSSALIACTSLSSSVPDAAFRRSPLIRKS